MRSATGALKRLGLIAAGVLLAIGTATAAEKAQTKAAEQPQAKVRLDAVAVNLSGIGRVGPVRLEIVIERWSSDETRDKLIQTLKDKGSDKLMDELQDIRPRAGFIRTTTSLGWDIQYAQEYPLPDGGRRIVFVTDRPMSFREASSRPRSSEYDFMTCEIRLDKDGVGEGRLAPWTRVRFDAKKHVIELENYGIEPVRLTQVTVEK
jgi:hypothetical protein